MVAHPAAAQLGACCLPDARCFDLDEEFCNDNGGGFINTANASYATIPGGFGNVAGGDYSLAAGRRAKVRSAADVGGGDEPRTAVNP